MKIFITLLLLLGLYPNTLSSQEKSKNKDLWIISAPANKQITKIDKNGTTIIPNGRLITPAGKCIMTAPHPYGLTLSPDGNTVVSANSGIRPLSITIVRNILSQHPQVQQIPPGPSTDQGVLASVFMGLAISPDNNTIYVAGGQTNKIFLFDTKSGEKKGFIDCSAISDTTDYTDGYIGDLVLSEDGNILYAVDQIGFRMIIINTKTKKIMYSVPVGRYPFGICLSQDEKKVYVANVGMFEYSYIKASKKKDAKIKSIDYPAFAYGSDEMKYGIENDTISISALGELNAIDAFSVFAIDVEDQLKPKVIAKIKTGHKVGTLVEGIPAVGGSSPNSIVATDKYVFVSNGTNDNISVISIEKDTIIHTIYLKPDQRIKQFRGVIPFGLALSPDNKRLYVAESGINAIAVIRISDFKVMGHIPTAWFPSKVEVSKDGQKLIIANAKGFGSGPNGGATFKRGAESSYIGSLMKGCIQIVNIPKDEELKEMTKQVISNNFTFHKADNKLFENRKNNPIPLYPSEKESPIKHIVFISKENRTYDEIFGQIKNGNGDSTIARYGETALIYNRKKTDSVLNTIVMPNHLALAKQFAISDNFYVDADVSADGHRWLTNTYPNEWCETATPASYGGNRNFKSESNAPGIFAMNGAAGAIYPEDYNEAGSMWDHLERHSVDFYNFGFSIMFEPALYKEEYWNTGIHQYINYPMPQPLFNRTSKMYPTYNMAITDQFRIGQFIQEFDNKWIGKKTEMPAFITVIIPNDHGAGERPKTGYPFRESYMADNDLAVGRIVEYLSHTPYWKNMLIVITEDDAQNGVDHVDAHRSVLMLISPWVKREYVSHVHNSFGSLFKTYWNILGLPYLNQYDAGATDLSDFFTNIPNFKPYDAVEVDKSIFDPQKALDPFDKDFDWEALKDSPQIDNVKDMMKDSKEQDKYRMENREK